MITNDNYDIILYELKDLKEHTQIMNSLLVNQEQKLDSISDTINTSNIISNKK